jgi:hypothetical protein
MARALGVICLRDRSIKDDVLEELSAKGKAIILLEKDLDNGLIRPNANAMFALVNFLAIARLRAKLLDGHFTQEYPQ